MGGALIAVPKLNTAVNNNVTISDGKPQWKPGSNAAKTSQFVKQHVKKSRSDTLTDAQLKRRKKLSANTTILTSTLGLGALAAHGGGAAAAKFSKVPKVISAGKQLKHGALPVSLVSGGISGASGYNYASIQRAEARRRQPMAKAYDPERSRQKRNKYGQFAATGVGVAGLGGAGASVYAGRGKLHQAYTFHSRVKPAAEERAGRKQVYRGAQKVLARNEERYIDLGQRIAAATKPGEVKPHKLMEERKEMGSVLRRQGNTLHGLEDAWEASRGKHLRAVGTAKRSVKALKPLATRTGVLAGVGAAGLGGAAYLHNRRHSSSWGSHSPRYQRNR